MKKRFISLALAVMLVLTLLPTGAMAYRETGYRTTQVFQYEDGELIRQIRIRYNDVHNQITEDTFEPDEIPGSFSIVSSITSVYDESGRCIREVENWGEKYRIDYTYEATDDGGRQIQTNAATGDVTVQEYKWDASGYLNYTRTLENGVVQQERFLTCDEDGNVVRQEQRFYEDGQLSETEYSRMEYDAAGRNTAVIYTDANGADLPGEWVRMTYDAAGNLVKVQMQSGGANVYVSEFTYDANGNQSTETTTYADGSVEKYEYQYEAYSVERGPAFVDVQDENAYYYKPVDWAVEQGITNGTDESHFSPELSCNRAQMVTFLWRAAGSPEPKKAANPFSDVKKGAYYYDAVLWAVENGITQGTGEGKFSPEDTVSRGQTVTFLYRFFDEPPVQPDGAGFSDVHPGDYFADAVIWALDNEITNGTGDNRFQPNTPCTRAQIVTFLYRAMG